ncbi:MAG: DUF502 domain-containing protein [Candidatus Omnitrophica bacterium]|nr:DUF502 domain-containing protein [Candidatus Omnitrophota bacterium]
MLNRLKRYFVTGLVAVVPVFLTIYILGVLFRFTDNILGRFLNVYLKNSLGFYIPGLGIVIFLLVILLTGFLANRYIGKKVFHLIDKWFSGLPLIRNIYPAFKQVISFILAQKEFGFKKVVLVEYPSKGIFSLGFLTNEEFSKISLITNREMVSVFMPTSPGPFTGVVIFVAKEDLRFPEISISDAFKIIISGGVFKP